MAKSRSTLSRAARTALSLAALCAAVAATAARAEDAAPAAAPAATPITSPAAAIAADQAAAEQPADAYRAWGASLAAGFPDGATLTLDYRPLGWLRVGPSLLWNYAGFGVGATATVAPRWYVAPSFTVEGGKFFSANWASTLSVKDDTVRRYISDIGYTYLKAQVGLEMGGWNSFSFYLRAGMTRMYASSNVDNKNIKRPTDGSPYVSYVGNPDLTLSVPCVNLGFTYFFY